MKRYATITATGSYLPPIEVSNETLRVRLAHVPDYVDKMEAATGILKRWYAPDDWSTSDLAVPAAREALKRAGKTSDDVDLARIHRISSHRLLPLWSRKNCKRRTPARLTLAAPVLPFPRA
jgi:3-oxoacyl-[acyl-carrier-protein] synthase III